MPDSETPPPAKFANVAAVARRYGVGRSSIYRLIGAGSLRAVKFGSTTLVEIDSGDEYFRALPAARIRQPAAA